MLPVAAVGAVAAAVAKLVSVLLLLLLLMLQSMFATAYWLCWIMDPSGAWHLLASLFSVVMAGADLTHPLHSTTASCHPASWLV